VASNALYQASTGSCDTPADRYKYEGASPVGSTAEHRRRAAYYNMARRHDGDRRRQWKRLAMGCNFFGIELKVYMVKVSYFQKPYRRSLIETFGAKVVPSPSPDTQAGRNALAEDPDATGSLGLAISEAVEDCVTRDDTKYSLGSVLNHVLLHQTIIGEEAMKQMEMAGDYPDVVIGCVGGGSNFGGMALPFARERLKSGKRTRLVATEPEACPSITRGADVYDYGDTAGMAPIVKMFTLGHTFAPPAIHAGGLRYHGMAPLISELQRLGMLEAKAYHQNAVFQAAVQFARSEESCRRRSPRTPFVPSSTRRWPASSPVSRR
jgi:tryptophan synthase beta chain